MVATLCRFRGRADLPNLLLDDFVDHFSCNNTAATAAATRDESVAIFVGGVTSISTLVVISEGFENKVMKREGRATAKRVSVVNC